MKWNALYGTGDYEDLQEVSNDKEVECYYVLMESIAEKVGREALNIKELKKVMRCKNHVSKGYDTSMWDKVEARLGTKLPSDYKEFINEYGTGSINEFLWILTPFDENEYVNLIKRGEVIRKAYIQSRDNAHDYFKHKVFPEKGGILPWAYTDNGDELYWLTSENSDEWHIVIYESRSPDYCEYNMGMVQFIYEAASGKLICDAFPEEECEFISC